MADNCSTVSGGTSIEDLKKEIAVQKRRRDEIDQVILKLENELKELEKSTLLFSPACADTLQAEDMSTVRYKRISSRCDNKGGLYEVKMCGLLFARALQSDKYFHIASSVEAALPFDDIVLRLGDVSVFLQLKHSKNTNMIYDYELVFPSSKINLLQYCKLCLEMKTNWADKKDLSYYGKFEEVKFVFFTNSPIKNMEQYSRNQARNSSDILCELEKILNTSRGCFFKVTRKAHDFVYKIFENLPKYKQILSDKSSSQNQVLDVVRELLNKDAAKSPPDKDLDRLLKQLEDLGDLSEYEHFLSQLYFCVGQVSESALDTLIKRELDILCGESKMLADYQAGINAWWQNSNCYLTEKSPFWQSILQDCVTKLSRPSKLTLTFSETELDKVRQQVASDGNVWHFVSTCNSLSCLKLEQSLDAKFVIDVNILQNQQCEVLKLWKWFDLLVILEDDSGSTLSESLVTELISTLMNWPHKNLVIISGQESGIAAQLQNRKLDIKVLQDIFSLTQLDSESQDRVYKCNVMFQGYSVPVESLDTRAALQEAITGGDVIDLLSGKLAVGERLDEEDSHYIARTLLRKEHVVSEIFSTETSDQMLAISGASVRTLRKLLSHEDIVKFGDDIHNDNRCVLLSNSQEFWKLCEKYENRNVHWLCKQNKGYVWRRSRGDITQIRDRLANTETSYDDYRKIQDLPHTVAVIVAEPGMGKSTELSHLATKLKKLDQEIWLIRIDLNDHTDFLSQEEPDAFHLLQRAGKFSSRFQMSLLKHQVYESGNVVVLIDGFDEISPEYSDKVLGMLKTLLDTRISHICVTSRPVMKTVLEDKLGTLSFSFKPFTEEDQKEFLQKFWKIPQESAFDLNDFIDELLKLTAKSLNDKMKKFTGIPLQTKMLAEIFQSRAEQYAKTGKYTLPQKLDLLQLYDDFVDRKWEVYCSKNKEDMTKVGVSDNNKVLKEIFHENNMICGLVALLEAKDLQVLPESKNLILKYDKFVKNFEKGHIKTGIVVVVNPVPVFVHRTFAEYFVAMWFSENFHLYSKYIKGNFFKKNNDMIRQFFDRMLARNHRLHVAVLNQDRDEIESLRTDVNEQDDGGRTALHLAVMNYLYGFDESPDSVQQITSMLLERGADPYIQDKVLQWSPLCLAEKTGAWSALEMILQKYAASKSLNVIPQRIKREDYLHNILRVSAKQGYVQLIAFLIKSSVQIDYLFPIIKSKAKMTMLHVAAHHKQLNLVKFLVEHKANVDARDETYYKRTPLMIAAREGNIEIVEFLLKHGVDVDARDTRKRTALWYAGSRGHAEVVLLLEEFGADVRVHDRSNGYTLLHFAVKFGNLEIISKLKNIALLVNRKNKQSFTPLLLAAKNGNWEAFQLLVKLKADLDSCDRDWNNALHYAAQIGNAANIVLCIDLKLHIESMNSKGQTPLLFAAAHKNRLMAMTTLHEMGADVAECDNDGNTGLHYAAVRDDVEAVDWFVDKGVHVDCVNDKEETPLLRAVQSGNVKVVDKLLELGADVNIADNRYNTPLHVAYNRNHKPLREKLIKFGASLTSSSNRPVILNTPLSRSLEEELKLMQMLYAEGIF